MSIIFRNFADCKKPKHMTRALTLITTLLLVIAAHASDFCFVGADKTVIRVVPDASSGLNSVFVAFTVEGLKVACSPSATGGTVTWYSFGTAGAAYAEKIAEGRELSNLKGGQGYIAESGNRREYFWLIDYSAASYSVTGLRASGESDCAVTELTVDGTAERLTYTAINGRQIEIDRQISLSYYTLKAEGNHFEQIQVCDHHPFLRASIHADAPLCDTRFCLTGDRFLREWGMESVVESEAFTAMAVSAVTSVVSDSRDVANEQTGPMDEIGGSAPVSATFSATVTDAAVFTEWQIATDEEFSDVILRERTLDMPYTFTKAGSFFVKFTAADAAGICLWESDTYRVDIGESRLRCPNAFSPGASEGINDIWCVSYRSIVEFDCSIFNRWGVRMTRFTDPSQGWDGRYKGRIVDPGVYYYVIKARGSDGKIYNLSGDINIVGSRK